AVGLSEYVFFFFQAEDGIRDFHVTGVQTCALPISQRPPAAQDHGGGAETEDEQLPGGDVGESGGQAGDEVDAALDHRGGVQVGEIGRASCRERVEMWVGGAP